VTTTVEKWAEEIVRDCLEASGGDERTAFEAAEMLARILPPPQEPSVALAFDIYNRQAQGILNRSLQVANKIGAAARKELVAALRRSRSGSAAPILEFIDKYRVKLAKILTQTQIASMLEGAREVADKVPTLSEFPGAIPPPPTLEPHVAVKLVERLEAMDPVKQAEEVIKLPPAEQVYVRQAIAARAAPPPVIPPMVQPPTGGGQPEDVHFPIIDEAVRNLAERNVMTRDRYDALEAAARAKAFTVANVSADETLAKIRDSLAENVREGADYREWSKKVLADVGQGTFMSEGHQETVFRTNVQTAFADGQESVLQHPLVRSGFPYRGRHAIHDERVRENHLALEKLGIGGTNVYRADDPVWQLFRAPWDYNDRCSDVPMTVRQAAEAGVEEARKWLDTGVEPMDKSFVAMPDFQPPPGFQRSTVAMPLSIQLSMQPAAAFSTAKPEEETETSELFGQPEVGSIGSATLDTAKEGARTKRMKVGRAKTARGRKVRRSLFKSMRVKRKWAPPVSLAVDAQPVPGDDKEVRLDYISEILVMMYGDGAQDVARKLKAHVPLSIAMNLDAQGIWHGPTPPAPQGWSQIAPGPNGGLRWQHISGSPMMPPGGWPQSQAQNNSISSAQQPTQYAARKQAADKAYNDFMAVGSAATPAEKAAVSNHLAVMTLPQLKAIHNALGGSGTLTGDRVAHARAVRAILSGQPAPTPTTPQTPTAPQTPTPPQTPLPPQTPTTQTPTAPTTRPRSKRSGGGVAAFAQETNWDTDKPQDNPEVINGVPFAPAPPKFWESTPDVDIKEPDPVKPINRVGVLIKEPDGRIWVVQPTNSFGNRKYTLPGGHNEQGLTDQQNALKEVWEECGLQVKITGHLGDFEDSNNGNNGRLYVGERIGGQPWDAKVEPKIINQVTGKPAAESQVVTLVTPERAAQLLHRTDDLAQLMTVAPIKLDQPTQGAGSNPIKKFLAGIEPAVQAFKTPIPGGTRWSKKYGNGELHVVQNLRGFNNKPKVVKRADMDALIAKGDHIEVLRGVKGSGGKIAKQLADEFKTGEHFPGYGVFGSGTYTDGNSGYNNRARSYGDRGGVMRIAIPKTAKIVKQSELERNIQGKPDAFDDASGAGTASENWHGVHAALAGYDAIHVDGNSKRHGNYGEGFYIILNRSICTVQKEDAHGHMIP
jgi:ADP-ribose pyrophosphatase YjhB (NUDIX family)